MSIESVMPSNHLILCHPLLLLPSMFPSIRVSSNESVLPIWWCCWIVSWTKLLRVPWTAKRSNQSILKEISPEYSLEGLMLKLKPQYFGHLLWKATCWQTYSTLGNSAWVVRKESCHQQKSASAQCQTECFPKGCKVDTLWLCLSLTDRGNVTPWIPVDSPVMICETWYRSLGGTGPQTDGLNCVIPGMLKDLWGAERRAPIWLQAWCCLLQNVY